MGVMELCGNGAIELWVPRAIEFATATPHLLLQLHYNYTTAAEPLATQLLATGYTVAGHSATGSQLLATGYSATCYSAIG